MKMKMQMVIVGMVISFMPTMAIAVESGSIAINGRTWRYNINKGNPGCGIPHKAIVTDVEPKTGHIEIPSVFPNRPVKNEGGYVYYYDLIVCGMTEAFVGGQEITSISIPTSVTYIANGAFSACGSLNNIMLPTDLDLKIFPSYNSVTNVELYLGTPSISSSYFADCFNLRSVVIPEGITNIGSGAFADCHRIGKITMPESLETLEGNTFKSCYSLTNLTFIGNAPKCEYHIFESANRDLVVYVPVGSKGWDGNPESTALPKYWPFNTEGGRRIVHIGETINDDPPVVTNYVYATVTNCIYSTVTNYVFSTVTNEILHYSTVTNEIFHYTTVTNVVKYVPEPGASPDAGYGINVGAGGETVIAGAAGWDAFGVPDGMEWNKETGTLSGGAKLSGAYDLILVSGSGADTKIMRTTLTVAPYDTIVGYVGVAFSQGGAPLNNLKSYKTLPAGLKWKGGVLNGVPTKVQTLDIETVDGEPVKIEIKALPDSVVGTFDGCVYLPPSDPMNGIANTRDILGTITLSATAAGKLSASVKTAKKTYSFSMASWTKFAEGDAFTLEAGATLKTGETLQINATERDGASVVLAELSGGEFGDDGCVMVLAKDVYAKSGSKWIDADAHAVMAKCAGTYQFGLDAVENEAAWTLKPVAKAEAAFLKVMLKDTGVATISGALPDKTKINISAKAMASAVDGSDKVEIKIVSAAFSGKATTLPVEVNLMNDGSPVEGRMNCGVIHSVKR